MAFKNEITAGTTLIREAIQSQGFQAGVEGWTIRADGSAEFNDVVIRGGTVVSGLALYYDGPPAFGNLIMSIAASGGTDEYGNIYSAGTAVYGPDGVVVMDGSSLLVLGTNGSAVTLMAGSVGSSAIALTPENLVGTTWLDGGISTQLGASQRPGTIVASPKDSVHSAGASISLFGGGPTTTDTYVLFAADRFSFNNLVQIFDRVEAENLQSGVQSVSFAALSQTTVAVSFPTPYPAGTVPAVMTNINSGAAATVRWGNRAINITNSGFTLFVFKGDAADPAQTWTNINVQWWAHA